MATKGSKINKNNATEGNGLNITSESSEKAATMDDTEQELKAVINENLETIFEENLATGLSEKAELFINEKMSSIINEKVALASGSSTREKLSNIVRKVQKPPLPKGRKAYWNITESVPLDKVESFMSQPENSVDFEKVLQRFDKTYRTYKYIGYKLDVGRRNLLMQIPDLHRSVEEVAALRNESLDEFERQFLLNDHVYVKTVVPKTESVYLWLGGIIMLEYKLDEAEALLKNQLILAIAKLKTIEHDQVFLRQQIAICIENWTHVYNWVMERDAEDDIMEEQDVAEEDYHDDTDTEDPYTEECFPDEPLAEEGILDVETAAYPEIYAEVYADGDVVDDLSGLGTEKSEEISTDMFLDTKDSAAEVELAERAEFVIEAAIEEDAVTKGSIEVNKLETIAKEDGAKQIKTVKKSDADKRAIVLTTSSSSL